MSILKWEGLIEGQDRYFRHPEIPGDIVGRRELRFRVWEKMPKGTGEDYKTACDYFRFLPRRACCRRQKNKNIGTWDNLDGIRISLIEPTAQESSLCLINLSPSHLGSLLSVTHKHDDKHRCPGSMVNCLPAPRPPRDLFLHIFSGKPRKR